MKDGHMIDLKSCSYIRHDNRDAVHGISYSIGDEEGWTPVIGRKEKRSVPLHLLCRRAPPHVEVYLPSSDESSCESDSDCSDSSLVIPDHATVKFSIVDGKPGLQVNTRCASSWTPLLAVLEPNKKKKVLTVIFIV